MGEGRVPGEEAGGKKPQVREKSESESAQSCPTLCNPRDCSLPDTSVHGDSPGKNTRVDCHALLQGIFPTQGSSPGLLYGRQILYHLSYQGSRDNNYIGNTQ